MAQERRRLTRSVGASRRSLEGLELLPPGPHLAHRKPVSLQQSSAQWPTLTLVHTPVHNSWLNSVEIYFSIVQRKVVTPNDFTSLTELEDRLLAFQGRYERTAKPFQWTFTRTDLADPLAKLKDKELGRAA